MTDYSITSRGFERINPAEKMKDISVPKINGNIVKLNDQLGSLDSRITGLVESVNDSAEQSASASLGVENFQQQLNTSTTAINQTIENLGVFSDLKIVTLVDDITVSKTSWFEHVGLFSHEITIENVTEDIVISILDPENNLEDFPITLISKIETDNRIVNGSFTDGVTAIDYGADGIHSVPSGWQAFETANLNAADWDVVTILGVQTAEFSAFGSAGGISQIDAYTLNKNHSVTLRARKISGDGAATLNILSNGSFTEVVPADNNSWIDVQIDVEPTDANANLEIVNRNGDAVWQLQNVQVRQYADFFIFEGEGGSGDQVLLDVNGSKTFLYRIATQRFTEI